MNDKTRAYKFWTQEEIQYLSDNWGVKTVETLAINLKRTQNAVINKKNKLGLGAFWDNGDYMIREHLQTALGYKKLSLKKLENKRNLPTHKKRVKKRVLIVVYINEFWEWAEQNRTLLDFSNFEENALGKEDDWVKEKRRHDYEMKRKYRKNTPWTITEEEKLIYLLKKNKYTLDDLSEKLQRTRNAVHAKIYKLKLSDRPLRKTRRKKYAESIIS